MIEKTKTENKLYTYLIAGMVFIIPFFFLTLTNNFYILNKTALLYSITGLLLISWLIKVFINQEIKLLKTPLNMPILGFMIIYVLSAVLQSPNRMSALTEKAGVLFALTALYFIIINHLKAKKPAVLIMKAIIGSSAILSLLTIFVYSGLFSKIKAGWMQDKIWTPTGSILTTANLILMLLPAVLYWAFKSRDFLLKILLFLTAGVQILSLVIITSLFMDKTITFNYLMPNYGWQIAVEGFKNLRTALLGVGPNNFLSAFSRFRPAELNNTYVWLAKFITNSNQYFNILSTIGVLGLVCYVLIAWKSLKRENFKGSLIRKVLYISLLSSFILQLLISADFIIMLITFVIIGLLQTSAMPVQTDMGYEYKIRSKPIVYGVIGGIGLLILSVFYWQGRIWAGDYFFRKSLVAAKENKGNDTYNFQIKAIKLNPFAENYRIAYSNTNLALANSLASQKNLTDQKKENINQLISQAIREAKSAVSLNPQISAYWVNLANIYRSLINGAQGSDQWAISSYAQAVRTDPTNPVLRVELGGLFYALKDYDNAVTQFIQSINLKPDYANGYYNLAVVYKEKKEWQKAFENMKQVLSLIPADGADYQKANDELETLRKLIEPVEVTPSAEMQEELLKEPKPLPSGQLPVELPEESGPEIPEIEEEEVEEASPSGEPL